MREVPMRPPVRALSLPRALVLTLVLGLTLALSVTMGCAGSSTEKPNPVLASATLSSGPTTILAELARTEEQRMRGLMFRKQLDEGKGMLFVFDTDSRPAFWMKNTRIPLSLAYIASDGTITQILDLVPFSTEPRPSERLVRYALEVPRGWFAKAGLQVGSRIEIPDLQ